MIKDMFAGGDRDSDEDFQEFNLASVSTLTSKLEGAHHANSYLYKLELQGEQIRERI